jgi:hypothetical protein
VIPVSSHGQLGNFLALEALNEKVEDGKLVFRENVRRGLGLESTPDFGNGSLQDFVDYWINVLAAPGYLQGPFDCERARGIRSCISVTSHDRYKVKYNESTSWTEKEDKLGIKKTPKKQRCILDPGEQIV